MCSVSPSSRSEIRSGQPSESLPKHNPLTLDGVMIGSCKILKRFPLNESAGAQVSGAREAPTYWPPGRPGSHPEFLISAGEPPPRVVDLHPFGGRDGYHEARCS
jgi:hypothetical protein